jgi:hypothetical protein
MAWSVRFDVKLRSGMEISYLVMPFMQNHDRILPEAIEKDDQAWKYALFSTKAVKFLIKRQGFNSTQSCDAKSL